MGRKVEAGGMDVDSALYDFVSDEAAPGTGVAPERFWEKLAQIVQALNHFPTPDPITLGRGRRIRNTLGTGAR